MVENSDLETTLLEFRRKSFSFDRTATVGAEEFVVFSRRETESESRLRPKLVRLFVVVPRDLLIHDLATDSIRIAPDGAVPGPSRMGEAQQADAEPSEFGEQGVDWKRLDVPAGIAYLPTNRYDTLAEPTARAALGLA